MLTMSQNQDHESFSDVLARVEHNVNEQIKSVNNNRRSRGRDNLSERDSQREVNARCESSLFYQPFTWRSLVSDGGQLAAVTARKKLTAGHFPTRLEAQHIVSSAPDTPQWREVIALLPKKLIK